MPAEFESECSCPQNALNTYGVRGILSKVLKLVNFGALSDSFFGVRLEQMHQRRLWLKFYGARLRTELRSGLGLDRKSGCFQCQYFGKAYCAQKKL